MSKQTKTITIKPRTMSSLEIAELTGKQHPHVRRDIEKILNEVEIEPSKFGELVKMPSGQTSKVYNLPRRECDLIVSGYSAKYRLAIIDRWHELEKAFENPPRTDIILDKRSAHHPMMDALVDMRKELGKETKTVHYMCENKLCNGAVTGNFKSANENELSNSDVELLAEVRRMNQSLLQMDMEYKDRKKALIKFAMKRRTKLLETGKLAIAS
jgi:phage regulator Rha-like protein